MSKLIKTIKAQAVPDFITADTAFSTALIIHGELHYIKMEITWMDLELMIEDHENPNKYRGAYTGFPQYGVAVLLELVIF